MAGKATSKTARASMPTGAKNAFQTSSEVPHLIPCGGATAVYVHDPRNGHNPHFRVGDARLVDFLAGLAGAGYGELFEGAFEKLAANDSRWDKVVTRLREANAFGVPEAADAA